jgi:hypothetical protein
MTLTHLRGSGSGSAAIRSCQCTISDTVRAQKALVVDPTDAYAAWEIVAMFGCAPRVSDTAASYSSGDPRRTSSERPANESGNAAPEAETLRRGADEREPVSRPYEEGCPARPAHSTVTVDGRPEPVRKPGIVEIRSVIVGRGRASTRSERSGGGGRFTDRIDASAGSANME